MFWGCVLKEGQPYKVQHALEDGEFPVLHLSSAVLARDAKKENGKSYLTVSMKETNKELKNLTIAVLSTGQQEMQNLNVYFNVSQNITITCHGKNEVHLSGYFEPNNSMEEGMYGEELDDEDDDLADQLESDSEDEADVIAKMKGTIKADKKPKEESIEKSLKSAK